MTTRDLGVQGDSGLNGGLGVELGRKADLEEHVLHHVAAVAARELERLALEQHIVEAPGLRRERRRVAHFSLEGEQGETHCTRCRVAGCPGLARPRVGRVPVGAQRLAVDERLGDGIDDLVAGGAQQTGADRTGGDLDQHHVIEA
jgi:hypothetical protein